jgi:3-mercaptopyruvate sulfurtransferase SseA
MKKMSLILLSTVTAVILAGCNGELEQLDRTDNISRSADNSLVSTTDTTSSQTPIGANLTQTTTNNDTSSQTGATNVDNSIPGGGNVNVADQNNPPADAPGGNPDANVSVPGGGNIPGGNPDANVSVPDDGNISQVTIQTPAQLATTSSVDYAENSSGIITADTLSLWLESWEDNKPASATGRLVVLQAGAARSCNSYLKGDGNSVVVYNLDVSNATELIDADKMDQFINQYAIDPQNDYIVLAVGNGLCKLKGTTQTWWALKYHGYPLDKLAILDGTVSCNFNSSNTHLAQSANTPTPTDTYHMSTLNVDRSSLHINEADMSTIAQDSQNFIADVRCGSDKIEGARRISYKNVLTTSCNSFKFKSQSDLQTLFISKGYEEGKTVYIHSKAGYRSTVVSLVTSAVLGYPTQIFDGEINNSQCNCQ